MKLTLAFLLAFCIVLTGCSSISSDSGKLTTEKAQGAIDEFARLAGGAQLRIRGGVREIPAQNAALAEFNAENFNYKGKDYTGKSGEAHFSRYTDGQWTLTKVVILLPNQLGSRTWETAIKVR